MIKVTEGQNGYILVARNSDGKDRPPDSQSGTIPHRVVTAILLHEEPAVGEEIKVWNEIRWTKEGEYARAFPRKDKRGKWYDWLLVGFEDADGNRTLAPSKALAFYQRGNGEKQAMKIHHIQSSSLQPCCKKPSCRRSKN